MTRMATTSLLVNEDGVSALGESLPTEHSLYQAMAAVSVAHTTPSSAHGNNGTGANGGSVGVGVGMGGNGNDMRPTTDNDRALTTDNAPTTNNKQQTNKPTNQQKNPVTFCFVLCWDKHVSLL